MRLLPSEHDLGEDDIYDCVPCEDDGDDIYEDIIKVEVRQPMVRAIFVLFLSSCLAGLLNNVSNVSHREKVMMFIHLCCFAFLTLQIRYMQVSDAVIVTLPHTDNHHQLPSLHLKLTSKVPRERADSYVIDWGGGTHLRSDSGLRTEAAVTSPR